MKSFSYDIKNGELVNTSTVWIDCGRTLIHGVHTRRMWDESLECYKDVTAFYVRVGAVEYGKIGLTLAEYLSICSGACIDQLCPPDKIYVCVYDDQYI